MIRKLAIFLFLLMSLSAWAQNSDKGDFNLVLAGDSNLHQRLSIYDDPKFLGFYARIRKADAAFVNIESQFLEDEHPGAGNAWSGGIYLYSPAWLVDEYKWAGFNLISVGNNHAFDYGPQGLKSSIRVLNHAGIVWAGAGDNLAYARAPGYLDTKHGRVALIAITSTLLPGSQASQQRPDLPGRFGLNPLRFNTTYTVDSETLQSLRKVAKLAHPHSEKPDDPVVSFGDAQFKLGEPGVHTEAQQQDWNGLLASIRDARRQADWVVVTIHGHEGSASNPSGAADFIVAFAHAAIDAGADVFANHAPHDVRGIEIYKGKPIFYGLGNFAFDGHVTPFQPEELYDQRHLSIDNTISDLWKPAESKSGSDPRTAPGLWNEKTWEEAVFELSFSQDHKLKKIVINPISLLWTKGEVPTAHPTTSAGVPGPASPEAAARVIDRIAKQSVVLGTKVVSKGDHAEIVLE